MGDKVKTEEVCIDISLLGLADDACREGRGPDSRRWCALFLYWLLSTTQAGFWGTFSSVPWEVTEGHFPDQGVTKFTVDTLLNWGLIVFVPALVPAMWLHAQRAQGLLLALRLAALLTAAGAVVRCLPSVIFAHVGQIFIGLAGPLVWNACGSFSSAWFPPEERTFATAVGGGGSYLGSGIQFLAVLPVTTAERFGTFLYAEAVWGVAVLFVTFLALPAGPRWAPSVSAASHVDSGNSAMEAIRHFGADLAAAGRNSSIWLIGLGAGIASGLYGIFSSSFPVVLHKDEGSTLAKVLGFASILAFVVGSVLIGYVSDRFFQRELKKLLVICFAVCLAGVLVFAIACPSPISSEGLIRSQEVRFTAIVVLSMANGGIFPVAIELAAEIVFPTEESVVVGAITTFNTIIGIWYLLGMDRIPNIYVSSPVFVGTILGLAFVLCADERYLRRDADERSRSRGESARQRESREPEDRSESETSSTPLE